MPSTSRKAATLFRALSDDTRLEILACLRDGEQCVCDLTASLGAAQSRLSFHLRVLKEAGLIHDRRDGRWVYYSIDPDALDDLRHATEELQPRAPASRTTRHCS